MNTKIPASLLSILVVNQIALTITHYPTNRSVLSADAAVVWDAIMEKTGGGIPILTDKGFYDDTNAVFIAWRKIRYHNMWESSVLVMLGNLGLLACPE